ncbi:MAG: geranylgeranyl reductase family protein [Planctomycetota bacterium]|jgi:flavin-dependent dehydrogenase
MKRIAIVGCSFAGLITGYYITKFGGKGISLTFFDRKKRIGDEQTSACAAPVRIVNELGLKNSILKNVKRFNIITNSREYIYDTPTYAIFDYRSFCAGLKSKIRGKFILQKKTDPRNIRSDFDLIIDASGWSSPINKNKDVVFALETVIDVSGPKNDALNFYLGKKFIDGGYCWAFPVAKNRFRVGIGSFKKLKYVEELRRFVSEQFGAEVDKIHGGFIPRGVVGDLVKGNIICVGDSASHTYPISLEGIRPTFFFSKALARNVADFSKEKISFEEMKKKYIGLNESKRSLYNISMKVEKVMRNYPILMNIVVKALQIGYVRNKLMKTYFEFM